MDIDFFRKIPMFKVLEAEDSGFLASRFVQRSYSRNTVIINEGDDTSSLYIILKGRVKIFLNDDAGKEIALGIEETGGYFGEVSLLDAGPRSASIITLEDSCFAVLKKQDFIKTLTDCPPLALSIIQGLTERLRVLTENVRSLALMDVYGRVARQLMDLASKEVDGRWIIEERLTYNDLASRVGASTKMVGRIMQDLTKGGYIRKESRQIIIERNLPSGW